MYMTVTEVCRITCWICVSYRNRVNRTLFPNPHQKHSCSFTLPSCVYNCCSLTVFTWEGQEGIGRCTSLWCTQYSVLNSIRSKNTGTAHKKPGVFWNETDTITSKSLESWVFIRNNYYACFLLLVSLLGNETSNLLLINKVWEFGSQKEQSDCSMFYVLVPPLHFYECRFSWESFRWAKFYHDWRLALNGILSP